MEYLAGILHSYANLIDKDVAVLEFHTFTSRASRQPQFKLK